MMDDQARDDLFSVVMCLHCGSCNYATHHFCRDCGRALGARYVDLCLARIDNPEQRFSLPEQLRGPFQLFLMGLAVSILLTILVMMVISFAQGAPVS
jgi:hypothetical protein